MLLHWKDDIADLKNRAAAVMAAPEGSERMSARTAAAVLAGICGLISRRWTTDHMQRTCAELARFEPTWASSFGRLPTDAQTRLVTEATQLLAAVARAVLPLAGADNLRAALSFWASENDPSVWTQIAA